MAAFPDDRTMSRRWSSCLVMPGKNCCRRVSSRLGAAAIAAVILVAVACTGHSSFAQSLDRDPLYDAAVDDTHQDGTLGTTTGFWQQLRDSSSSRQLTQITGPGDGNIWTTIGGVQYIQMTTLVDAVDAAFFRQKTPGQVIYESPPAIAIDGGGIWLTTGNSLNDYLQARRSEWGVGTDTTAAKRATQALGGPLDTNWQYEVKLWVQPQLLYRPAVQWSIEDGTILQTADHLDWNDLLVQGFDASELAAQRAGPVFVLTDPSDAAIQPAYAFSAVWGANYASPSDSADIAVPEWFNQWWNNSRLTESDGTFPFPWTALGFTYDWYYQDKSEGDLAGVMGRSGLSEFVFPQNDSFHLPYLLAAAPQLIDESLAVPEIDPHGLGTALVLIIGSLGLLERRLQRVGLRSEGV